jgi:predicted nucleic acid-binding protein
MKRETSCARAVVSFLNQSGAMVPVAGTPQRCRDPRDDVVIETVLRGNAEALVTGDRDLLDDAAIRERLRQAGTRVVTAREFLDLLDEPEAGNA